MDQEIKEIFEKLFQILVDCNLVKVMDDAEQIKEQLWFRFYPLIQELVKSKTDLNQFLKKTMALLDIDENLKSGLNCLFERIISELELLKFRFATQQSTIDNHEKKIDVLESEIKLQKARVIAFDVIRLFRFYYIDDILKGSPFSTWQSFTNEWAKREADVLKKLTANDATIVNNDPTIFDKVQQDPSILQLIDPIERVLTQKWNVNLKLTAIRDIANDRHGAAHTSIKTAMDQRCFLVSCNNFKFPAEYQYAADVTKLINILNGTKLKRYC